MVHLLLSQLRFARSELVRCLEGVAEKDACTRVGQTNCTSWIVGHMAAHENWCWVKLAHDKTLMPRLYDLVGYGKPASTPSLEEMWSCWNVITSAADEYLDALTPELLETYMELDGTPLPENIGTMLLRNIYHYWFHTGEAHAVCQQLGHEDLPEFVGDMSDALYGQRG